MAHEFEFVGRLPSPTGRGRDRVLDRFAAALRSRPGEWAVWPKPVTRGTARTYATAIARGVLATFPAGEFEAAERQDTLYVRYVGVPDDAS